MKIQSVVAEIFQFYLIISSVLLKINSDGLPMIDDIITYQAGDISSLSLSLVSNERRFLSLFS